MKNLILVLFLSSTMLYAQRSKSTQVGRMRLHELSLTQYDKDTTAKALVLYEHGNLYIDPSKNYKFRTDYYRRLKVFHKDAFGYATIKINLYKKETVEQIVGVSYHLRENGTVEKTTMQVTAIFENQESENWKSVTFTLPNIKEGSVIEYSYSTLSGYPDNIRDWYFQDDIPKLKSDYDSAIIGNYIHYVRKLGSLPLVKNETSVKKNCVYIDGIGQAACGIRSYSMENIPSFKEEEYMLSRRNFVSRLVFDLATYTNATGIKTKFLDDWKSVDRRLRLDFFNNQTSKTRLFKKQLPEELFTNSNPLEKAKNIYNYIRDQYSWDGRYWDANDLKVRELLEEKSGGVDAINIALYNSLQAAEIESYIAILSTRDHGLPTDLYPILRDFNYIVVKVVIDQKTYFLDATQKQLPFGMVPFKCLNGQARVLDFDNESYWETIPTSFNTYANTRIKLKLDTTGNLSGTIQEKKSGYLALDQRNDRNAVSEDRYLERFESKHPNIEVEDYEATGFDTTEGITNELYTVAIDEVLEGKKIFINPFIIHKTTKNPFTLNQRDYPVDYGYPSSFTYLLSLEVPENYTIVKLPESEGLQLPNAGGQYIYNSAQNGNKVNIYFKFILSKKLYSNEEYYYLKELYHKIIKTQQSDIILEKLVK